MKKAYMHAIEGVIASMLVLLYLSTLISSPEPTDWRETALTQRSGDVMEALTETGTMERALINDDPGVIRAVTNAIGAEMEYTMFIDGLPRRTLDIGILMNGSTTQRTGTNSGGTGNGLPGTEHGYRSGNIHGVDFILADNRSDGIMQYDTVNFDFDDDGIYDDTVGQLDEGPHRQNDKVRWCPGGTCTDQVFQIGHINDTLTLYNLTSFTDLNQTLTSIGLNRFDIEGRLQATDIETNLTRTESGMTDTGSWYETSFPKDGVSIDIRVSTDGEEAFIDESSGFHGPYEEGNEVQILGTFYTLESLLPFNATPANPLPEDMIIARGYEPGIFDRHEDPLLEYLADGGNLLQMTDFEDWDRQRFQGSFHDTIGLDWAEYPLETGGTTYNIINDGEAGYASDLTASYFNSLTIDLPEARFDERPTGSPEWAIAETSFRGQEYTVNASLTGDSVEFSKPGFDQTASTGEDIILEGNLLTVQDTHPLKLGASEGYKFANRHHGNVIGGQPLMEAPELSWNSEAESINVTGLSDANYDGSPPTECSDDYKGRVFTLDGQNYGILTTNLRPCDIDYEYVNFDFNMNGAVDDNTSTTGEDYGSEGIYQDGEQVLIDDRQYRLEIGNNGTWVYIERVVPDTVATALWVDEAYAGDGDVFISGTGTGGIDDEAFIRSAVIYAATDRYRFSNPRSFGSPSVGIDYTSDIDGDIYMPYTVESVWWFQ